MLKVHEIFRSIQGEGVDTGIPCVFVRLYGCNVKCTFCDQPQKPGQCQRMSIQHIIDEVQKFRHTKNVCITGGEPLIQEEVYPLIYSLVERGYNVSIETNGCTPIDEDYHQRSYKYVMDIKCPSSGVSSKNIFTNIKRLHPNDEIKFVVADRKDYEYARNIIKNNYTRATILFSPMFDENLKPVIGSQLCDWICEDFDTKDYNVRVQIQLHKILGVL